MVVFWPESGRNLAGFCRFWPDSVRFVRIHPSYSCVFSGELGMPCFVEFGIEYRARKFLKLVRSHETKHRSRYFRIVKEQPRSSPTDAGSIRRAVERDTNPKCERGPSLIPLLALRVMCIVSFQTRMVSIITIRVRTRNQLRKAQIAL